METLPGNALKRALNKSRTAQKGKAMLKKLGPRLQERGIPGHRYIMVDIGSGAFVTGQSPGEAADRFALMHPSAFGWLQQFSDVRG